MQFQNRERAGERLADELVGTYSEVSRELVVLALPRGGVPVAGPVARRLAAVLDVLIVRKLGIPGHSELAMGALAGPGVRVLNEDVIRSFGVAPDVIERVAERELEELHRREELYRGDRPPLELGGRRVILVDDGLATGATMKVAIEALRQQDVERLTVAVPVAAPDVCRAVADLADDCVCLETPEPFVAVGRWYREFPQTGDEEVRRILAEHDAHMRH